MLHAHYQTATHMTYKNKTISEKTGFCTVNIFLVPVTGLDCVFDLRMFEMIYFLRQGELMMNWRVSQPEERCCFFVWWYGTARPEQCKCQPAGDWGGETTIRGKSALRDEAVVLIQLCPQGSALSRTEQERDIEGSS